MDEYNIERKFSYSAKLATEEQIQFESLGKLEQGDEEGTKRNERELREIGESRSFFCCELERRVVRASPNHRVLLSGSGNRAIEDEEKMRRSADCMYYLFCNQ